MSGTAKGLDANPAPGTPEYDRYVLREMRMRAWWMTMGYAGRGRPWHKRWKANPQRTLGDLLDASARDFLDDVIEEHKRMYPGIEE